MNHLLKILGLTLLLITGCLFAISAQEQTWTFGTEESFDGKYKWAMVNGKVAEGPTNTVVAIVINDVPSTVNGVPSTDPENNLILNVPEGFVAERGDCQIEAKTQELRDLYNSMGLESFGSVKIRFAGHDEVFSWAVSGNIEHGRCIMYISRYQTLEELNQKKPNFVSLIKSRDKMFVRFIPSSNCSIHDQIDMEFLLNGSTSAINHMMN